MLKSESESLSVGPTLCDLMDYTVHGILQARIQEWVASGPITSWEIDGETVETVTDFYFLGLQNHCRW